MRGNKKKNKTQPAENRLRDTRPKQNYKNEEEARTVFRTFVLLSSFSFSNDLRFIKKYIFVLITAIILSGPCTPGVSHTQLLLTENNPWCSVLAPQVRTGHLTAQFHLCPDATPMLLQGFAKGVTVGHPDSTPSTPSYTPTPIMQPCVPMICGCSKFPIMSLPRAPIEECFCWSPNFFFF